METKQESQLLVLLVLCSLLFSQALALPLPEAEAPRYARHSGEEFNGDLSSLFSEISAINYLESLTKKRARILSNGVGDDHVPINGHSEAIFTDKLWRFLKKVTVRRFLKKMLSNRQKAKPQQSEIWYIKKTR